MERVPVSIFLLKPGQSAARASSPALSAFDSGDLAAREIQIGEMSGRFWIGQSQGESPDWVKHFGPMAGVAPNDFRATSVQGALAVLVGTAEFLFTFGHAWRRVRVSKVVPNFGLKCVLNLCRADELRAIKHDRIAHDYIQTIVQSPEQADIHRFGIDIEQDLLRGVRAAVDRSFGFGATVSGSDAFKFTYSPSSDPLQDLLSQIENLHKQSAYRRNFGWVDDIVPVRDETLTAWLEDALAREISANPSAAVLCLPDFEGWESYDQYVFGRLSKSPVRSTLSLDSWLHYIRGEGLSTLTANVLREQKIHAQYADNSSVRKTWSALECIHAVVDSARGRFIAHGGDWFQLGEGYLERLEKQLSLIDSPAALSIPRSTAGEHEGDYNLRSVRSSSRQLFLLDKNLVSHGGGRGRIEVCDMLSTSLQLICVKRWCNSAGVSHLCSQALNAARLIRGDNQFVEKVGKKLKGHHRAAWLKVQSRRSTPEFVLALMGGSELSSLPLFSRMTILNAAKQLRSLGFKVSYARI